MSAGGFYEEVEIEDMDFDEDQLLFHFPCPCGDRFEISLQQLKEGDDVARCPSCSLIIRIIYDPVWPYPQIIVNIVKEDLLEDDENEPVTSATAHPVGIAAV